jgi:hypothetical protein
MPEAREKPPDFTSVIAVQQKRRPDTKAQGNVGQNESVVCAFGAQERHDNFASRQGEMARKAKRIYRACTATPK